MKRTRSGRETGKKRMIYNGLGGSSVLGDDSSQMAQSQSTQSFHPQQPSQNYTSDGNNSSSDDSDDTDYEEKEEAEKEAASALIGIGEYDVNIYNNSDMEVPEQSQTTTTSALKTSSTRTRKERKPSKTTNKEIVQELMENLGDVMKNGKLHCRYLCKKCKAEGCVLTGTVVFPKGQGWTNPTDHVTRCVGIGNLQVSISIFILIWYVITSTALTFYLFSIDCQDGSFKVQ